MIEMPEIFNSDFFHYVYIFRLGFLYDYGYDYINEVYILSEDLMTRKQLLEKKRVITSTFNLPVIQILLETLNQAKTS